MTNAELIVKIRNEIERLTDELELQARENAEANNGEATDYCFGVVDMQMNLLSFLSTLESEKPINLDDAMKELDEKIALVKQRGTWKGVDVDKYMDEVRGREPEKPMNLEEEINLYLHEECSGDEEPGIHEIAEHFAEWGYLRAAEKYNEVEYNRQRAEESVPNDLEEAAWDCVLDSVDVNNPVLLPKYKELLTYLFIAGAKWDRNQMLKEAEEGRIGEAGLHNAVYIKEPKWTNFLDGFKKGDKVRVIIVKED